MKQGLARHSRKQLKGGMLLQRQQEDIRSLNSSILVITQKMKYVVRNEKILGRNLIVLNKKLKALEEKIAAGDVGAKGSSGASPELTQKIEENERKIAELEARLQQFSESTASKEELQEMHYVVDSINPLQFVTLEQAKDLVSGKKPRRKSPKKHKKG